MLVLPHADSLGVDFHQLCQRVLQAPGNGHGGAEIHVILGKFLGGQRTCGVHGGPGLGHDHIADVGPGIVYLPNQLHGHLLCFPAGGTVADGDVLYAIFADELCQRGDGLVFLALPIGGVHHGGVQRFAGPVHHSHLAAHAVAGVQPHGDPALYRRLHQKRL